MNRGFILTSIIASIIFTLSFTPLAAGQEEQDQLQINSIAVLDTDFGIIKFELYENLTPNTTQHFIELAESGHYDGVLFHRIVDDFVVQTGDGGGSNMIPLEIHPNATHVDGAVGMARSNDPDSAEDQFYICDGPQHGLDGDYAVFGIVIEGIEVVREIAKVPVYGENNPRPGAIFPPLWENIGMPKEDVYLNEVQIETPEINETATSTISSAVSEEQFPFWALGFIVAAVVVVYWFFIRNRRGAGTSSEG
jgi:cyclophilin family peptidyl-prolyl cis-trans isomerase